MSKNSRRRAALNYDRLSRWYDFFSGAERKANAEGLLLLRPEKSEVILEIGPGTGRTLSKLASAGVTVCGLDISSGMLKEAKKRAGDASLIRGDATALPFEDRVFDAVFMGFTLELFDDEDMKKVLSETRRVLKPGGRVCMVSMASDEKPGIISSIYSWAGCKFPGLIDCKPIILKNVLEKSGFNAIKEKRMSLAGLPVMIVLAS